MEEYSNCSMAECFTEKSSLCQNEQACQGLDINKTTGLPGVRHK